MKKIIVTPAGRKRYLEVLLNNLIKCIDEFDEWHLWVNTTEIDDILYMEKLCEKYDFINLKISDIPINGDKSIYRFFKDYVKLDEVYLRLDDDIVYIKKNSISSIFEYRLINEEPFLVYGNIVNNSIISHLHQRMGIIPIIDKIVGYNCLDPVGWNDPFFALSCHENFFKKYENNNIDNYYTNNWILYDYNRFSINVISWLGKTFLEFNGEVGIDEEEWLSYKPMQLKRPNVIFGKSLFSNYSFFTQREYLDKTNILSKV